MQKSILTVALNSGRTIPALGFGTYQIKGEACYQAVLEALKVGYTHIDTASVYRNEEPISRAIKDSNIPR